MFANELYAAEEKWAAQIRSDVDISSVNVVRAAAGAPVYRLGFERELDDQGRIEWRSNWW
jgi:hypothetical protein